MNCTGLQDTPGGPTVVNVDGLQTLAANPSSAGCGSNVQCDQRRVSGVETPDEGPDALDLHRQSTGSKTLNTDERSRAEMASAGASNYVQSSFVAADLSPPSAGLLYNQVCADFTAAALRSSNIFRKPCQVRNRTAVAGRDIGIAPAIDPMVQQMNRSALQSSQASVYGEEANLSNATNVLSQSRAVTLSSPIALHLCDAKGRNEGADSDRTIPTQWGSVAESATRAHSECLFQKALEVKTQCGAREQLRHALVWGGDRLPSPAVSADASLSPVIADSSTNGPSVTHGVAPSQQGGLAFDTGRTGIHALTDTNAARRSFTTAETWSPVALETLPPPTNAAGSVTPNPDAPDPLKSTTVAPLIEEARDENMNSLVERAFRDAGREDSMSPDQVVDFIFRYSEALEPEGNAYRSTR
ncbi:hypothetical protein BESB_009570 [Besnoitia besnoiti]|uniref:Uncharacterized protein n=1 Tax=Besnoitia besnoiti TaxID=94643 RepID=A0A2A9MKT8_BESBE|nr:hypothetical protein BESB_009570 [Besnoitia besnoiti]PFH38615.1 hypothetical protein BESB_009570 [Besnoitia besnoiti]